MSLKQRLEMKVLLEPGRGMAPARTLLVDLSTCVSGG